MYTRPSRGPRFLHYSRRGAALALAGSVLVLGGCAGGTPPGSQSPDRGGRRAIVLSIDSFSEMRLMQTVDSAATPTLRGLFAEGACADAVRSAMPTMTVAGHASLWTGAYGNVTGIATTSQPQLPRDEHAVTDLGNAFRAAALRAEPLWVTLGAAGLEVFALNATHSPEAPGYPDELSVAPDPALPALRARAAAAIRRPNVSLLTGYNEVIAPAIAVSEKSNPPHDPPFWLNLDRLGGIRTPPVEVSWAVGTAGDSLHALIYGTTGSYARAVVAPQRDVARGVIVRGAPTDTTWPTRRTLARHFSPPLRFTVAGRAVSARIRLFDLAADGRSYLFFVPELDGVRANRPELQRGFTAAVPSWTSKAPEHLYVNGKLGPRARDGGDGTAERRYAEMAELYTAGAIAATDWAWRQRDTRLLLDYFLLLDDTDHRMLGDVAPASPLYDARVAAIVQEVRRRAWALTDLRVARLLGLARAAGAALFVVGDHGMRVVWRTFRPNVLLQQAGLQVLDAQGRVDLSRSRAYSPSGAWIMLNRRAWKGGIVPPAEERDAIARIQRALMTLRGPDGDPVVTRLYDPATDDSLGIGGPVGGDVYYGVAPGYHWNAALTGAVAGPVPVNAEHGFPSVDADMKTVLCAVGPEFPAHRIGETRTIDLAPTIEEYFGVQPPATVRGRSVLGRLLRP